MSALLPCPHCCGKAVGAPPYRNVAICTECGARGPIATSSPEAIDAWNRRTGTAMPDLVAALKEAQYFILAPAEDLKEGVLSRIRAAIGETGMVLVTGKERPMLRPEVASTEARFESASLHQVTEAMVEAGARKLCRLDGRDPDGKRFGPKVGDWEAYAKTAEAVLIAAISKAESRS